MSLIDNALEILRTHWGYDSFRPLQPEIITSVLEGRDTLGLLPTGGGKSLTFQVPALMLDGVTLVVTPLVSLMKDQVDNLRARDIDARLLHAGMTAREIRLALDRCRYGRSKLLYVSPEKLQSERFLGDLRGLPISLIVVDEAHCISQWGYDFRPAYLRIGEVRKMFPKAPVLALTASATPEVADDIMARLGFSEKRVFSRSFSRDNLSYIVRYDENKERRLIEILRRTSGCTIVYVRSRRRTRELAELIFREGISAGYYHAGLSVEEKNERQNDWKEDRSRVMVATNAFGMGIDKPDVRYVIHYDLPSSLEEYYQEAGRAGRDGKPAFAVVIASQTDKGLLTRRLGEAFPPKEYIGHVYETASVFLGVGVGEGYNHMLEFNFPLYCDRFRLKATVARNALMLLTRAGYIDYVDEISTRSRVMMIASKEELYNLSVSRQADRVLQCLLRCYTGLFADYVDISEGMIARKLDISEGDVYQSFLELQREHVLHYIPKRRTPYIFYPTSREDTRYLAFPRTVYEDQRARMERRIEAMKRFVYDDTASCRVAHMLRYFGEKDPAPCGCCDLCRDRRSRRPVVAPSAPEALRQGIRRCLDRAAEQGRIARVLELEQALGVRRDDVVRALREMISVGTVSRGEFEA
ncbi:MAG: RecQ family ATP-dependent DNA helicase [Clostridium sp.]|nr:RecQ family ATP-dependent DNA helicase [Clostridium sp.]